MKTGIDIVKCERVKTLMMNERIFNREEIDYCLKYGGNSYIHFAGMYAAKEAFLKALGQGIQSIKTLSEIVVSHAASGEPFISCSKRFMDEIGDRKISLSISHTDENAVAICIIY